MNKLISGVLLTAALAASSAFAQSGPDQRPGGPGGPGGQMHGGPGGGEQMHGGPGGGQMHGGPGGPGGGHMQGRPGGAPMHADRGGPPQGGDNGDWRRRGGRLPSDYRDRQYVVDDYRGYNLQPPPRGYHWVGVNGDYLLVGIASGVIAQVLSGH